MFFSPFSIAITSLGEERANLSAFRTFVRFVLVWICRFPFPLGVWEGLRFVIVALPGLFSYLFFSIQCAIPTHSVNVANFDLHCFICSLYVFQVSLSLESIPIRTIGVRYTLMIVHCDTMADHKI